MKKKVLLGKVYDDVPMLVGSGFFAKKPLKYSALNALFQKRSTFLRRL